MKNPWITIALLMLVFALVWPYVGPEYQVYLSLSFFSYSVALLGFNLLFNYTGLLSFGHALFLGLGGYATAFLTSKFHMLHMEVSIVISILISGFVALLVGLVCVRYVKIYFAMLTLAFGMLFHSLLMKTYHLTGGDEGMPVEQPYLLGIDFSSMGTMDFFSGPYYYYSLGIFILALILMWRIVHSPFGLCLMSIRDNPDKAEYLGIPIRKYRLYAFIISGCFTGVGGVMMAPATGHMDPGMVFWPHSGDLVFMTLLGGFSNFFGPLLGSIIFIYLRDVVSSLTEYWRLIFGGILAAIVILSPGGVMEVVSKSFIRVRARIAAGEKE
jgi:branched-chain amino acid transport system permease protein